MPAIDRLCTELKGIVYKRPYSEALAAIHERLTDEGVPQGQIAQICKDITSRLQRRAPRLSLFELFLTRACNLACSYCFVKDKGKTSMTSEVLERSIAFITSERDPHRTTRVLFFGGEPLMELDLLKRVVEELELRVPGRDALRFDITTNGTLITERVMEYLARHRVRVLISVDGGRESHDSARKTTDGHGSFEAIMERLPIVERYQPYLGTKLTVTPPTVGRLFEDVKELVARGFRKVIIGPATGMAWDKEARTLLRTQIPRIVKWSEGRSESGLSINVAEDSVHRMESRHRWGCRAGRSAVAIDCDGCVYPCSKLIGVGQTERVLCLGSVEEGMTAESVRDQLTGALPVSRKTCWSCPTRSACNGGCYAVNYQGTGDAFAPDPSACLVTKTVVDATNSLAPSPATPSKSSC
jgi:uncharacterized protein